MIVEDLRIKTKTENILIDSSLEINSTGIPTGRIVLNTNMGFKITILRNEALTIASYLVGLDKAIEQAENAWKESNNLPLEPENSYSRNTREMNRKL